MTDTKKFSDYSFISIGANLPSAVGSPEDTIAFAFESLARLSAFPILKSSLYASSPVDSPEGTPDFLNTMAGIIPHKTETPLSLLHKLQEIEKAAGRTRSGIKNEARTLDLDLILFKEEVINISELILPHPRASQRRFVLEPLVDITGAGFRLTVSGETLGQLVSSISGDQKIRRL